MRSSKTERTREHIIAATAPVFNRKGYAGTSITDLTQATKLTSGSIYGNFENKEEVALAAFDFNLESVHSVVQRAVNKCKTTKEKLMMSVLAYHSSQRLSFPGGGCPMQNTLTEADDSHEGLRLRAAQGLLRWKKDLMELINTGIAEKVIVADTDAEKIALHVIALIEFGFLISSATRDRKEVDKILDLAVGILSKTFVA
ncbi:TetR/AcrR family transcriptional regulator [Pedobacter antarcticus]|uniref:TetR/AcrR family transcriptional regulator n=1 Tax=Pedobacter antarcticus TaxID=34086 RepID=UPI001C559B2F|nr:TetR/AcrR family transcriptional regulator [Pedobacter antarcticus]